MPTAFTTSTEGMPSIPPEVLAAWEVDATTVEAIDTGQNSMHWRVRTRGHRLALRHYGRDTTPADIDREFDVLGALAAHGVGVPVVAPTARGEASISVGGDLWAAFEWIEGRPPARSDLEVARTVGLALALAHEAPTPTSLASTPRLRDFADTVRWAGLTLRSSLPVLRRFDQRAAQAVTTAIAAVESQIEMLPDSGPVVVHGDLHPGNVLVDAEGRVWLLDWAFARRDQATADLGVAYRAWPEVYEALLAAYSETRPVTAIERACVPALAAARGLDHLGDRITRWAAGMEVDIESELAREVPDLIERVNRMA